MRIFKLVLISFFLITSANSNSIYNLIKIPNLEIYELKTPNKLKYFYATKPFRLGVQKNIDCSNSDKKTYDEKYQIISSNLKRYSKEFLKFLMFNSLEFLTIGFSRYELSKCPAIHPLINRMQINLAVLNGSNAWRSIQSEVAVAPRMRTQIELD